MALSRSALAENEISSPIARPISEASNFFFITFILRIGYEGEMKFRSLLGVVFFYLILSQRANT